MTLDTSFISDDLSDEARYPDLSDAGREMLRFLRENVHAPRYTAQCGHRIDAARLAQVRAFAAMLETTPVGWAPDAQPPWLAEFAAKCYREVPFYRRHGALPQRFTDIPTCERADLSREIWSFVPDSQPLDGLIWYNTTGTTGHPLRIISHPVTSACYLPLLRIALAAYGIRLTAGRGRVAYLLVGWQRKSYAYPSVVPEMDDAGCAKLNLHPSDWNDPDDRAKFLDDCDPEFYTGDPLAFAEMARLPMRTKPRALISTAMMLLPGLRQSLEDRFGCPVIDIYSMNETGPIAYLSPDGDGYIPLQPRLYIEILDSQSFPCPAGARGEVVLSGGMNPFLPLLRYRTDDFAGLTFHGHLPLITGLQGRPPTLFRTMDGTTLNNLDVTNALTPLALPQFTLHQAANGALTMQLIDTGGDVERVRAALLGLFGNDQPLTLETVATLGDKVIQYASDITT